MLQRPELEVSRLTFSIEPAVDITVRVPCSRLARSERRMAST